MFVEINLLNLVPINFFFDRSNYPEVGHLSINVLIQRTVKRHKLVSEKSLQFNNSGRKLTEMSKPQGRVLWKDC